MLLVQILTILVKSTCFWYNVTNKKHSSALPIKLKFKFDGCEPVPAGVVAYALFITKKVLSGSSDGQKHFGRMKIQLHT